MLLTKEDEEEKATLGGSLCLSSVIVEELYTQLVERTNQHVVNKNTATYFATSLEK